MSRSTLSTAVLLAFSGAAVAQSADMPPTQPGNVRAALYNKAGGELFWQRSTDDRGAVTGYEITRNGESLGIRDALSFYDPSLEPGVAYTFTVVAIDSAGQRSTVATTTLGGATIATPASGDIAAPQQVRVDVYSRRSVELFWNRESAALALRYEIRRDGQVVGTTDGVSFYTTMLSGGTDYLFDVIAIGRDGRRSSPTSVIVRTDSSGAIVPGSGIAAPADLRAQVYSRSSAELFWNRAATSGLRYEISRDGQVVETTDGTSFYDDALSGGTTYDYEVVAIESGERSGASTTQVTTTGTAQPVTPGTPLEVRDSFASNSLPQGLDAVRFVSFLFEARLPQDRPYLEQSETSVEYSIVPFVEGLTESVLIDIDAGGTGTYRDVSRRQDLDTVQREDAIATRTHDGTSTVWAGTFEFSDSSSGRSEVYEFTTQIRSAGERTLLQSGQLRGESSGTGDDNPIDATYELSTGTGDGQDGCGTLAGTIVYDSVVFDSSVVGGFIDTLTTINKQKSDDFWTVRETNLDDSVRDEYLVASLGLELYCDFPEI